MTRRCSHCNNNGHNARTCPTRGVKLFGVRLTDGSSIRKSASMGNLTHFSGSNPAENFGDTPDHAAGDGYASEDFVPGSGSGRARKKGNPWTEEEHRMFLLGLQKLGKGDWRGISRNYVITRTPTQVASHAQKYFIRQSNMSRRKRRSSLFDIVADESVETPMVSQEFLSADPTQAETQVDTFQEECESMESANTSDTVPTPKPENLQYCYPVVYPAYVPYPVPFWMGSNPGPITTDTHEVLKPTAVHSKAPINLDQLVGMSKLSIGGSIGKGGPSSLSVKLREGSSRQSAFHAKSSPASSGMNSRKSPIHAI
ncbi:hypothetical protein DCAR_0205514 [Daucus carota subsp. sativus]|uniref:Uncharacterized protein n=1 Tax=Daucus carota subsp. sativus TaxID=79200 RepID=A0A161WZJ3_DAUCS|nr:PREDICTED: transcription factor MYB1R1-like [Daucus carota subsp. sativus]WOG86312.1 hypothetical protein DCAR_0205514 [Daucus carota subsp. sativus]